MLGDIRIAIPGQTIWDKGEKGSVRGLHMKVTGTGKKVFLLYYRTRDGKERRPKIGELGQITLSEARRRATVILAQVSEGRDPKGEWEDKKTEMTVAELFQKAWDGHWSGERYEKSGWAKEVKRLYENVVDPVFGKYRLSDVTVSKVRDWHKSKEKVPYTGNRALEVFKKIFVYAEEHEIELPNGNPCRLVKSFKEKKRKRFATEEEIKRIYPILEREVTRSPAGVAFLYLLIFSGSRPRAIERCTWDQLKEFERDGQKYGVITFHGKSTDKTGDEEVVILPPQAMKALNRLPRIEGETICRIQMPRGLWRRIKKEVGCPDLWARDWRRTFATVGMSGGIDIGTIGELLNHHSTQTTKIYAKLMDGKRIEAATAIADRMESLLKPELKLVKSG